MTEENENLRRAQLLLDVHGQDWAIRDELVTFIRRPELRRVAEIVLALHPSFASTTVLRKLLEADEALGRALALHVVLEANDDLVPPVPAKEAPADTLPAALAHIEQMETLVTVLRVALEEACDDATSRERFIELRALAAGAAT